MDLAAIFFGLTVILSQVITDPMPDPGNAIVSPGSSNSTTNVTNVTNVFPPPDPQFVIDTESHGAPVIMKSALGDIDKSAADGMVNALQLGLKFGQLRKDLILSPTVQELNNHMTRIIFVSLGLVIAALCLWGLLGHFFGSDGHEAFEMLGRVPLWVLLAASSLAWLDFALNIVVAIGGVIASSAHGAFGATLTEDFWANEGVSNFTLLIGLFMFLIMALFVIKLFTNTAFLAFCALVARVFIFMKTTPWTGGWGDRWFRMVPATAGDLLAMLTMLVVGAALLDHLDSDNALETTLFVLGLLLAIGLVEELFGVRRGSAGGRLWEIFFLSRLRRAARGSGAPAPTATPASSPSPTSTSRAPRWATP